MSGSKRDSKGKGIEQLVEFIKKERDRRSAREQPEARKRKKAISAYTQLDSKKSGVQVKKAA